MREILFRGKRIDNGEWVEGCFIEPNAIFSKDCASGSFGTIKGIKQSIGLDVYLINPETIGQFTGLTDKNGVKIFEGDILKCINPNDGEEFITDFIASLVNGFTFKNVSLTRQLSLFDNDWPDEIEVIGNIHDNPELL